jgi:ferredoxin
MIVGNQKPLEEIVDSVNGFKSILVLGCGTCVTVCLTGGSREAQLLSRKLSVHPSLQDNALSIHVDTIEKQCELDLINRYLQIPESTDAILSLACGAGVQTLVRAFPTMNVIPALNTKFIGSLNEPGVWTEQCRGCGDCMLAYTGGICPVSKCAKKIFNGPCGGSSKGKCEIRDDVDCAWQMILDRLKALDRMEDYLKIHPPKDWSSGSYGEPQRMERSVDV